MIGDGYRAGVSASPPTVEELTALRADNERLAAEREHYRELYLRMLEQCRKLELGLLGQKAERLVANDAQLTMRVLATLLGERPAVDEAPPTQTVREHKRQKPTGRKPLPESLPRVEIEMLPDEVQREGLDAFERIGEDAREIIERRPASIVVVRLIYPKFVRKDREGDGRDACRRRAGRAAHRARTAGPGCSPTQSCDAGRSPAAQPARGIYARDGLELARARSAPGTTSCAS